MTAKTQELQAARDLQGALSERLNALRAEASDLMAKQAAMCSERPRMTPQEAAVATVEDQEAERTLVERRNAVSRLQGQVEQAITEQRQRVVELEREIGITRDAAFRSGVNSEMDRRAQVDARIQDRILDRLPELAALHAVSRHASEDALDELFSEFTSPSWVLPQGDDSRDAEPQLLDSYK